MTTAEQIQLATDTLDKVVIPLVGLLIGWAALHFGLKQQAEKDLAVIATRQDLIGTATRTAVAAAEQQFSGPDGAKRKEEAIKFATTILAAHGITLTDDEQKALAAAIEAQVFHLKQVLASAAPRVSATPGPGQEATAVVQPAPERPPAAVMTPFAPTPAQQADVSITTTTSPPSVPPPVTPDTRTAAAPQKGGA